MIHDPDLAPFYKWLEPDDEDQELRDLAADEWRAERWLITAEEDALICRLVDLNVRLPLAGYAADRGLMEIKAVFDAARHSKLHLTGFTPEQFSRLMDYEEDLFQQWHRALMDLHEYRLAHPMDAALEHLTPSTPSLN